MHTKSAVTVREKSAKSDGKMAAGLKIIVQIKLRLIPAPLLWYVYPYWNEHMEHQFPKS